MLRRSFFLRIVANVSSRPTPNPDCLQFRPMTPLDGVLPPGSSPCEVPYKAVSRVHPLSELLFEHYEREVRSVFLAEDYIAVTKWSDVRWTIELERSICGVIGSFLMTNDNIPCDESEMADVERDVGLKVDLQKDSEVLQCIKELLTKEVRPMVQRDGGDIKLMEWAEADGVLKLKMLGACKSCPSSQNTLKEGIERMLQHFVPEVKEVVEFKNREDNMMDAISKQRLAAAVAAEEDSKKKKSSSASGHDDDDDEENSENENNNNKNKDQEKEELLQHQPVAMTLNPQTITATASWNIKHEIKKQIDSLKEQEANEKKNDVVRSRGFISSTSTSEERANLKSEQDEMMQARRATQMAVDPHAVFSALAGMSSEDVAASKKRQEEVEKELEREAKEKAERWAKARAQQRRKVRENTGMMDDPEG